MERDDYKKTGLDEISDEELKSMFGRTPEKDAEEDRKWIQKGKERSITCFVCGIIGYAFVAAGCCLLPIDIAALILFIVSIVAGNRAKGHQEYKVLRILGLIYSYTGVFAVIAYSIIYIICGAGLIALL